MMLTVRIIAPQGSVFCQDIADINGTHLIECLNAREPEMYAPTGISEKEEVLRKECVSPKADVFFFVESLQGRHRIISGIGRSLNLWELLYSWEHIYFLFLMLILNFLYFWSKWYYVNSLSTHFEKRIAEVFSLHCKYILILRWDYPRVAAPK